MDARNSIRRLFQCDRRGGSLLSICKLSYATNTNMFSGLPFCLLENYLSGKMGLQIIEVLMTKERSWQECPRTSFTHWTDFRSLQNKTQNGASEQNLILSVKTVQTITFWHLEKLTEQKMSGFYVCCHNTVLLEDRALLSHWQTFLHR